MTLISIVNMTTSCGSQACKLQPRAHVQSLKGYFHHSTSEDNFCMWQPELAGIDHRHPLNLSEAMLWPLHREPWQESTMNWSRILGPRYVPMIRIASWLRPSSATDLSATHVTMFKYACVWLSIYLSIYLYIYIVYYRIVLSVQPKKNTPRIPR